MSYKWILFLIVPVLIFSSCEAEDVAKPLDGPCPAHGEEPLLKEDLGCTFETAHEFTWAVVAQILDGNKDALDQLGWNGTCFAITGTAFVDDKDEYGQRAVTIESGKHAVRCCSESIADGWAYVKPGDEVTFLGIGKTTAREGFNDLSPCFVRLHPKKE
jgi:hypothetical protein